MEEIKAPNNLKEELSLGQEFVQISQNMVGKPLDEHAVGELYNEYDAFFFRNNLQDFMFKIDYDISKNYVTFVPLRKIDQLALRGLLTL